MLQRKIVKNRNKREKLVFYLCSEPVNLMARNVAIKYASYIKIYIVQRKYTLVWLNKRTYKDEIKFIFDTMRKIYYWTIEIIEVSEKEQVINNKNPILSLLFIIYILYHVSSIALIISHAIQ